MDNNTSIEKTLETWRTEHGVTLQSLNIEGQPYFELKWQRPDGAHAYIDVYPHEDEVIVQHGIAYGGGDGPRQHGGMNRWCSRDLRENLKVLKGAIDRAGAPEHRSYTPRPKLGTVASLKLR